MGLEEETDALRVWNNFGSRISSGWFICTAYERKALNLHQRGLPME